jgi:hypothetical protein
MPKTCPVCSTTYPDTDAFCPKDGSTLRLDEGSASLVGSVIADRYLVSKLLGEGGMGQVYLAGHVRLPGSQAVDALPGFAEGDWWVQDIAASLPARLLGDVAGLRVLDFAAGGGLAAIACMRAGAACHQRNTPQAPASASEKTTRSRGLTSWYTPGLRKAQ